MIGTGLGVAVDINGVARSGYCQRPLSQRARPFPLAALSCSRCFYPCGECDITPNSQSGVCGLDGRRAAAMIIAATMCASMIRPPIATVSQPCLAILASMGIRPDDSKPAAARALQRRHTLLAAWLDALNQLDGPSHRRAVKLRQEQQLRRDSPIRRVPNRGPQLRALVHPTKRPRLGDRSRAADSGSTFGRARAASGFSQIATPGTVAILELD